MIIEVTRVFADYDSDDKPLTNAKAKGNQDFKKTTAWINPAGIQLICKCEFNPKLLEVWYENDVIYLADDMDKLANEWDYTLEENKASFTPDPETE